MDAGVVPEDGHFLPGRRALLNEFEELDHVFLIEGLVGHDLTKKAMLMVDCCTNGLVALVGEEGRYLQRASFGCPVLLGVSLGKEDGLVDLNQEVALRNGPLNSALGFLDGFQLNERHLQDTLT